MTLKHTTIRIQAHTIETHQITNCSLMMEPQWHSQGNMTHQVQLPVHGTKLTKLGPNSVGHGSKGRLHLYVPTHPPDGNHDGAHSVKLSAYWGPGSGGPGAREGARSFDTVRLPLAHWWSKDMHISRFTAFAGIADTIS